MDYINKHPRQPKEPFWPALRAFIGMVATLIVLCVVAAGFN
jgi:hypothetical protein